MENDGFEEVAKQFRIKIAAIRKEAEAIVKPQKCALCGKPFGHADNGICNSHSIPQFVLENIAEKNGNSQMVCVRTFDLVEDDKKVVLPCFAKNELGASKAGIFQAICRKCDNEFFKDYENEDNLLALDPNSKAGNKILAEIMIKSHLARIAKISLDYKMVDISRIRSALEGGLVMETNHKTTLQLDKKDAEMEVKKCREIIEEGLDNQFIVPVFKILPYRNQIATQIILPVSHDLKGKRLVDVMNFNPAYHLHNFCIVSFPLKHNSLLMMFCLKDAESVYGDYARQISCLSLANKMKLIQSLVFSQNEEIYLTCSIAKRMAGDKLFREVLSLNIPGPQSGTIVGDAFINVLSGESYTTGFEKHKNYFSISSKS